MRRRSFRRFVIAIALVGQLLAVTSAPSAMAHATPAPSTTAPCHGDAPVQPPGPASHDCPCAGDQCRCPGLQATPLMLAASPTATWLAPPGDPPFSSLLPLPSRPDAVFRPPI